MMLSQSAETWVNQTFERLTVEERVGRLLVPMLSATGDEALAYAMGEAAAVEGRACGYHCSFGPVVAR